MWCSLARASADVTTTATTTVTALDAPRAVDRVLTATVDPAVVAVAAIAVDPAVVAVAATAVGPAVAAAKAVVARADRHETEHAVQDRLGLAGAMAPVAIGATGAIGVPLLRLSSAMQRWPTCVPNRSPWPSS